MNSDGPRPKEELRRDAGAGHTEPAERPAAPAAEGPAAKATAERPANALTPEEQMALFEKELKENDWGHQPC